MYTHIQCLLFEENYVAVQADWCVRHQAIAALEFSAIDIEGGEPEADWDANVNHRFETLSRFYTATELQMRDGIRPETVLDWVVDSRKPTLPTGVSDLPKQPKKLQAPHISNGVTLMTDTYPSSGLNAKEQKKLLSLRTKICKQLDKKLQADFDLMLQAKNYDKVYLANLLIAMYQKIKDFDEENGIHIIDTELYALNLKDLQEEQANLIKLHQLQAEKKQTPLDKGKPNQDNVGVSDCVISRRASQPSETTHSLAHGSVFKPSHKRSSAKTMDDYFKDFIGLESVREEVKKIIAFLQVQHMRAAQGIAMKSPPSRHMVFTGNPGTGKTEMARLIAHIMYDTGIVAKECFVEADRSDLIAEYLGQTAVKTKTLIERSFGGVLFIDEAYTLKTREDDMYGDEAIATLLKMMEDHRDKVTVIVAGYEDEMQRFIASNPGLKSRFNRYIDFPDYDDDQLFEILLKMLAGNHYRLANLNQVKPIALSYFAQQRHVLGDTFANARTVRNYFEKVIEQQSLRVVQTPDADLNLVTATDFYL